MEYRTIIYENKEGIALIKLNRPKVLNAMNQRLWVEIMDAFEAIRVDDEVKVVILSGEGRAFSTGADLKDSKDRSPEDYRSYLESLQEASKKS